MCIYIKKMKRFFKPSKSTLAKRAKYVPRPVYGPAIDRGMYPMAYGMSRRRNIRTAGFLGIEKKFFDTVYAGTTIVQTVAGSESETATYGLICPQQGSGETGRDGRKIIVKSVEVNGRVSFANASDADDVRACIRVKVYLVHDSQTNGAQMAAEDCFEAVASPNADFSFPNLEHEGRFKILASRSFILGDKAVSADGANTASLSGDVKSFSIKKNVNIPMTFDASTGAVTDITDNSIHVVAFCSTVNSALLAYASRCRFVG